MPGGIVLLGGEQCRRAFLRFGSNGNDGTLHVRLSSIQTEDDLLELGNRKQQDQSFGMSSSA